VPAHTAIAGMMKVDNDITEALRNRTPLANSKLETLRNMTLSMVRNRGNVSQEDLTAFYAAGTTSSRYYPWVISKVISNYTNHIAKTPVDAPFQQFAWTK
jgi:hypothetical protein